GSRPLHSACAKGSVRTTSAAGDCPLASPLPSPAGRLAAPAPTCAAGRWGAAHSQAASPRLTTSRAPDAAARARAACAPSLRRRAVVSTLLVCFLGFAALDHLAFAASMGELKSEAHAVGLTPGSGGTGEQAALERMGKLALQFL